MITEQESVSLVSENRFGTLEKNYEEIQVNKYGCNEEKNFSSCPDLISSSKVKSEKQIE